MSQKGGIRFKPSHMSRRKSRKVLGHINKNKRHLSIKSRPLSRTYKSYKAEQNRKAAALRQEIEKFARRARGDENFSNNEISSSASSKAANRNARAISRALEHAFHNEIGKRASPNSKKRMSKKRMSRKMNMT